MLRVALVFSLLCWCQCIEERYLSVNDICKLKYYYGIQVYWELAVFGVANWRQSAKQRGSRDSKISVVLERRCVFRGFLPCATPCMRYDEAV